MATKDVLAVLAQLRKGAYTTGPDDPNYTNHWNMAAAGSDQIRDSVPGVAVRHTPVGDVKNQVNIRFGEQGIYLDTPNIAAVGPVARFAQRGLGAARLDPPFAVPMPAIAPTRNQPFTLQTDVGPIEVRPNPAVHVGRPSDLSGSDQVKNMWHLLRGK